LLYLQQQQAAASCSGDFASGRLGAAGSAAALLGGSLSAGLGLGSGGLLEDCDSSGHPVDEQFYTEAYPGKLCALCNLSERSFLGQGELVRYTVTSEVDLEEFAQKRKAAAMETASASDSAVDQVSGRRSPSTPFKRKVRKCTISGDQSDPPDELDMIGYQDEVSDLSLIFEPSGVFYAHFNCALWSGGVSSNSRTAAKIETTPGDKGAAKEAAIPLLRFVSQAVLKGLTSRCAHCKHYGATVPCKASERIYHWPCAVASGAWLEKASLAMVSVEAYDKVAGLASSNAAYLYYMGDQWKIGKVAEIPPAKLRNV
jgi:histone-lysine N-methyltransferase MLL3